MNETKISIARKKTGKTQDQVVKELNLKGVDIKRSTYLNWEWGETEPKASQVRTLSEVLHVSLNHFI